MRSPALASFFFFFLFLFLVACGSKSPAPGDGGGGGGDDLALPASSCQLRTDCRVYSSYCRSAPCQCLALGRNEVDPPCVVGTQSCIVDPCANKSADCQGGACVVTP